jgi:signal transduction histidine kinase/HAMP domain-containing protein
LSSEEQAGIQLSLNGVLVQSYVIPPNPGGNSAMISFIAAIPDEYGLARGVIIARTSFTINLFSQPAILALENIKESGGQGAILDESNRILFHTNPNLLMSMYEGQLPETSGYMEEAGATGTRQMFYAAIDENKGWKIVLSLPASYSQELALRIAVPLLVISLAISFLAFLLLRYMMKVLTSSLVSLAAKADQISKGELEDAVEARGVDEIGRLGSAFEQMRVSLKSRLEELDTLLNVSQGVASSLNLESASSHLLKAMRSYGADAASLISLKHLSQGWEDNYFVYRNGEEAESYAALDKILVDLLKDETILIIPSKARIRRMGLPKGAPLPSALAAIAIRDGEELTGFLWVVYSQSHRFLEPEVRFLNTLAGQAVLAVNNSNLYLKAEVGKRRLESVLASTPEPVFVADSDGRLLITNDAARQMTSLINVGDGSSDEKGEIISEILKEFLNKNNQSAEKAEELDLEDGRAYLVSLSPVQVENSLVGRVCVLRDVTEYKELAKMKSEYVSTVSHDLKTPLGLIHGYASMLQMVGEMNDQQRDYLAKILDGIDEISRMTDNLLDYRRIDSGIALQLEKFSPSDLYDQVVQQIQPQIKNRKVQVLRELTLAQDVTIEADKALLQRALYNLLENAVKFSPIGSQINLRLQVNDKTVVFEIQDHGPGIAPIDLPTIFDNKQGTQKKEGKPQRESGIGLSIVRSIADRHHGKVWVDSLLGKGCTFHLEIPIWQKGKVNSKKLGV